MIDFAVDEVDDRPLRIRCRFQEDQGVEQCIAADAQQITRGIAELDVGEPLRPVPIGDVAPHHAQPLGAGAHRAHIESANRVIPAAEQRKVLDLQRFAGFHRIRVPRHQAGYRHFRHHLCQVRPEQLRLGPLQIGTRRRIQLTENEINDPTLVVAHRLKQSLWVEHRIDCRAEHRLR